MATLSPSQIAGYASQAGFKGNAVQMAVAIALAESGGRTDAIGPVGEVGLWQIYMSAHPQYSRASLLDPLGNAQAAYAISGGGTSWRAWCTAYSDDACGTKGGVYLGNGSPYQAHLLQSVAVGTTKGVAQPTKYPLWTQPFMAQTVAWWEANGHHYPKDWGAAEGGVDWDPVPLNAPITALLPGVVVGSGYFCKPQYYCGTDYRQCSGGAQGYGVVTIRSANPYPNLVPGSLIDIYYQHIIIDPSIGLTCGGASGQQVQAGQIIGKGNGQYNIEVGINVGTQWGRIWGGASPGSHVDPIPFLYTLIGSGGVPSGISYGSTGGALTYNKLTDQVHKTLVDTPGFYGIALAVDEAEQFPGWVDLTTPTSISTPNITIPGQVPIIGGQPLLPGVSSPVPDFMGLARSIGATVSDNFVPFAIRSGLVALGLFIELLLIIKIVEPIAKDVIEIL